MGTSHRGCLCPSLQHEFSRWPAVRDDHPRTGLYTFVYNTRSVHMYCQNKVSLLLLVVLITSYCVRSSTNCTFCYSFHHVFSRAIQTNRCLYYLSSNLTFFHLNVFVLKNLYCIVHLFLVSWRGRLQPRRKQPKKGKLYFLLCSYKNRSFLTILYSI